MTKSIMLAVVGALVAATTAFAPAASAHGGYGYRSYYKPVYTYRYYKPVYTYRYYKPVYTYKRYW